MKPLHIALLVVAGAVGGALVMKVTQRAQPTTVAQVQTPAPPPAQAPEPAPAAQQPPPAEPAPAAESQPSSVPERREAPKPQRAHHDAKPAAISAPAPPVRSTPSAVASGQPGEPESAASQAPPPAPPPTRREPEQVSPPLPPPPPEPHSVTLNAGTLIPVRLVDGLSSERSAPGDAFTGTLDKELIVDGFVIAERGARVEGRVVTADRGGKVSGVAALAVELTRIRTSDGQNVAIQTDSFERRAQQSHGQDAAKVGVGAALGAAIGAIAGGGKGAAIGAGVGGGAGAGDVLLTRGKPATLPSETRINFRLRAPVTLTERLKG